MSLSIELFTLCEGAVADSRGALTLVGLGQNVILASTFPIPAVRTVVLLVSDDDSEDGSLVAGATPSVEIRVYGPDGQTVAGLVESLEASERPYEEAPSGVGMVSELSMKLKEPGKYRVHASVSIDDEHVQDERSLYVIDALRRS